jgi:hypothetical protein
LWVCDKAAERKHLNIARQLQQLGNEGMNVPASRTRDMFRCPRGIAKKKKKKKKKATICRLTIYGISRLETAYCSSLALR